MHPSVTRLSETTLLDDSSFCLCVSIFSSPHLYAGIASPAGSDVKILEFDLLQ